MCRKDRKKVVKKHTEKYVYLHILGTIMEFISIKVVIFILKTY